MRSPTRSKPAVAALLIAAAALGGCNKLQGRQHFHSGNAYYEDEQYRRAIREYQEGLALDPTADAVWRSVGLAALALYRPDDASPENQELASLAVDAFRKYIAAYPEDEKVHEYLVQTLMNAKRYDEAIAELEEDARRNRGNPKYALAVVRALTEAGKLEQAMERATQLRDPDVFYTIGVSAWAKSYYQPPPSVEEHRRLIELGLRALEGANTIRPDHFDTLSYLNLLWREKVKVEIDPFAQQEYVATAQKYFDRAMEIRREQERQANDKPAAAPAAAAG